MDLLRKRYDIVVVGAGPAGTSAAFFSKFYDKENKLDVMLLEKLPPEKYIKYHSMCGGCISFRAFSEIKPIKPKYIVEYLHKAREYIVDRFVLEHKIRGYILNRPLFLRSLIDEFVERGGEFIIGKIKKFAPNGEEIKIYVEDKGVIRARYLIAADGANSSIRRSLDVGGVKLTTATQYILDEESEHGVINFFYHEKYKGDYKWIFPYGEKTKVGFPSFSSIEEKFSGKIIEKHVRMIGWGALPSYVKGNILFVGDAAGQTNPLSKGGIRSGMYAGKLAAESIILYNNPKIYDVKWKKSKFYSQHWMKVFDKIKQMSNNEIAKHLEPFRNNKLLAILKIYLSREYKSYIDIYRAYALEQKVGW
ncbi:MAG: hypothetical protein DRN25_04685 [Thermoplasmata archaeon]|nr:MAG: hypothetical protein DRN25_04685 [Thermoplasmata archaeon]